MSLSTFCFSRVSPNIIGFHSTFYAYYTSKKNVTREITKISTAYYVNYISPNLIPSDCLKKSDLQQQLQLGLEC